MKEFIFKTAAFGGFEKKDVLEYIVNIREEFEAEKQNLQEHIRTLEQALEEEKRLHAVQIARVDRLQNELYHLISDLEFPK